jgi:hypothetical protein
VRLGDTASITSRGIEFLPASTGNKVQNVKISYCQYGILMTDQSRSSDGIGPDDPIFMEENVVSDVVIEDAFDYAIRIKSNNANAGANTERTTDDLILRNIECRRCGGGVLIEQTNRVQIDNIKFIDQTGLTSTYAMRLIDNTNLLVRGVSIINGNRGIFLQNCPDAMIDDVFFDLTGTIALDNGGGNTGVSVTEMKFRGTTATHDLTSTFTITNVTEASPAVVTVASTTGLTSGDLVSISGIVGTMGTTSVTGLNGKTYTVNVLDSTTFELLGTNTVGLTYTSDGTATQLTQSNFRALTNSVRRSQRVLSNILPDTTVTDATPITNDASASPTDAMGIQIISASFTPTAPATTLDIEVVIPSIATSLANSKQILTLFDGSTCIGVTQTSIDNTGATNNEYMRLRVLYPITGYTPRTLTARFGPRDTQTVTLTLFGRHRNSRLLSQPYMIINDLGAI